MRTTRLRALLTFGLGLGCALWAAAAAAQSPARERPRLKEFGKSLERLKWDEKKGAAAERAAGAKGRSGGGGGAEEDEVVRVETSLVVSDLLVIDQKGRAVEGLKAEDFLVTEDGRPQEVGAFSLGDDARVPRTIVLIIDYSGSQLPFIKMSVAAAKTLVDRLGPLDLMAVVTDDVELLVDFTADREKLRKGLDVLTQRAAEPKGFLEKAFGRNRRLGRSAQFSALMATLREMFDGEDVRPVVIFQTDGDELVYLREPVIEPYVEPGLPPDMRKQEERRIALARKFIEGKRREFGLRDVYAAAEKSRATVYTVYPGYRLIGLTPREQLKRLDLARERSMAAWHIRPEVRERLDERYYRMTPEALLLAVEQELTVQKTLVELSGLTGGWADFLEEPAQAAGIYERIFSDVNRRYVVGFYPTNKERDGKRRRVQVEVRGHPEYTVWGRKSYYAPGPDR